ncbi:MAG: hypothetical protein ATN36_05205 [Epulopiscium sp. Nele67-Bin005]|nr:MAG: hypothetical protein ATN36_05205 [Epulopiscium sp. Nele67-Bin005]
MASCIVRPLEIKIKNFKNVNDGIIEFKNKKIIKKEQELTREDILGIYGQNGSGKTALIQALHIIQYLLKGQPLKQEWGTLVSCGEENFQLDILFFVQVANQKYLITYQVTVKNENKKLMVSREKLVCSVSENEKWKRDITLLDYNYKEANFIAPLQRYREITEKDKSLRVDLKVGKELSKKNGVSFIFSEYVQKIIFSSLGVTHPTTLITKSLSFFAEANLYIISNEQLGVINMSQSLPLNVHLEKKDDLFIGNMKLNLFERSLILEDVFPMLEAVITQINAVLGAIIPSLNIQIYKYSPQYVENDKLAIPIELLSFKDNHKMALRNESDGIKKIISLLSTIIAMYNQPNICLVVDELDAGVFEYLLGDLLEIISQGAKGQLIFTSHNLRILEKLSPKDIVFTTTNPHNRYIKLDGVKEHDNLRDFYLRTLFLGGQKENLYAETNMPEIRYALRKAGKRHD